MKSKQNCVQSVPCMVTLPVESEELLQVLQLVDREIEARQQRRSVKEPVGEMFLMEIPPEVDRIVELMRFLLRKGRKLNMYACSCLEQDEIEQEFDTPSYVDRSRATFVAEAPEQTLQALKDLGYHVEGEVQA
ncbi:MAG TPA: hypothetical protein VEL31_16500 [Ktedonobacteraceae bacterium]|nr:hypothetical protein [Ktedonobacteraceae bacterium]